MLADVRFNTYSYASSFLSNSGSKLYVPVSKSALLYSHFDHVSGIAAPSNQNGISISKIRILNSLIDRLSSIKSEPNKQVNKISDEQADILIQNYQQQIKTAATQPPYALVAGQTDIGALFSFSV
ncbi:MAG: hypothetical protein GX677_07080 [Treponema sp.]|jgi:hypothetical protein|nr:hypothetical protein [Treponema sp.]